jgi:hypothetical protein
LGSGSAKLLAVIHVIPDARNCSLLIGSMKNNMTGADVIRDWPLHHGTPESINLNQSTGK